MSDRARRAETAVRLHDVERCSCTGATQAFDQVAEVQLHHRRDVGVGHGRRSALVFHDVRQDVARERDVGSRKPVGELLADPPFVRGGVVRVEERHGDRLHRPVGEDADHVAHLALVERLSDRPVRRDALVDLERELAGNEGLGLLLEPVVEVGAILTTELEHVAEAARREERRLRPAALEERVRADGGSVQERRDLAAHRGERLENADARVTRRRRDLRRRRNDAVGAGGDEVRERAARVDPDRETAGHGSPRSVETTSSSSAT